MIDAQTYLVLMMTLIFWITGDARATQRSNKPSVVIRV